MPTVPRSTRPPWMPERKAHGRRTNSNQHIYQSTRWRRLALAHKRANPLCVQCNRPVEVTDHPHRINDNGNPWDWNNLQSLCRRCHDAKSGREAHPGGGLNL